MDDWLGVPIANQEGVTINKALEDKRPTVLVNHRQLAMGKVIEEATFLSVYLERAARLQIRASSVGTLKPVLGHLA